MTQEEALKHAIKLLVVENDALRESAGMTSLHLGSRHFPPVELARGESLPGLVSLMNDGTLMVILES